MLELITDLWMYAPILFGISFSQNESGGSSQQQSSGTSRQGFFGPQRQALSEAVEPALREFLIPNLESQILGKPITRTTTVPGAPAGTPITSIGRRQVAEDERAEYNALSKPYTYDPVLNEYYAMEPITTTSTAAAPDTTKTETVGYESPFTFPKTDAGGFYAGQRTALDRIGEMALSRIGATGTTPESRAALSEALIANNAPALFDLQGRQAERQVTVPQDVEHGRVEDLLNAIRVAVGAVGGSSRVTGSGASNFSSSQTNFGFASGITGMSQNSAGGKALTAARNYFGSGGGGGPMGQTEYEE